MFQEKQKLAARKNKITKRQKIKIVFHYMKDFLGIRTHFCGSNFVLPRGTLLSL